ncbi:MAG: signal peptidase I [Robiginitomaculum sp.]|nr:MAG: signal peptidase I [Robiginitomaculum sp.]
MNPVLLNKIKAEVIDWTRFIALFLVGFYLFSTLFYALFYIPSGSMRPTLEVGDRFIASKWAYGWSRQSLPWGAARLIPEGKGRILGRVPKRGDVAVFVNPKNNMVMIKRVVGLPGDVIETRGGRLYINGGRVPRTFLRITRFRDHYGQIKTAQVYSENFPGKQRAHTIYELSDQMVLQGWSPDDSGPFTVKDDHVFMMGDNRDNSNDSRAPDGPGQVPLENLVGKAQTVVFTLARCRREPGLDCPTGRLWRLF